MFSDIYQESFEDTGVFYLDMWPLSLLFLAVFSPKTAIMATQTHPDIASRKPDLLPAFFKPIAGGLNLFDLPVAEWKPLRALFSKGFNTQHSISLVPGMVKQAQVYVETLRDYATRGDLCFLDTITLRFAMDMIGKTILSVSIRTFHATGRLIK